MTDTSKPSEFVLHDGTDEAKTEELHEFLAPIQRDKHNEWEGDDGGITIYLRVRPGDTIQMTDDGWIRVQRP